jgi:hypothetical protein
MKLRLRAADGPRCLSSQNYLPRRFSAKNIVLQIGKTPMISILYSPRDLLPSRARTHLAAGATLILLLTGGMASAQSVNFEGQTFVNKGLVGVARVPSNAVDQFGDTLGGFGSGMAMDLESWHRNRDGSFGGTLYMLPDRGWNTQGTVDYRGRLHRFEVTLNPLYSGSTTSQNQLKLDYKSSALFHRWGGILTTGLDPDAVQPADIVFPDLPINSSNHHIGVDDEAVVHVGDGTVWVSDEYGPYVYHYSRHGTLLHVIRPPDAFIPMRRHLQQRQPRLRSPEQSGF